MGIGGLLGAVSGAYTAIRGGLDEDQARRDQAEERAARREARDNARSDRAFGLQQRERLVADQQRQDQLRARLSAIPETRQVDTRPQAIREITIDDNEGPSATQIPVMQSAPRARWQVMKDRASAFREAGEIEKADAYEEVSRREQFAEGVRRFNQLRAGAATMDLPSLAQAAARIFNEDPLPAEVTDIKTAGQGLQFTILDRTSGRTVPLTVSSKEELLSALEGHYSPETYAAARQAEAAAALATRKELEKPVALGPGFKQFSGGRLIAENTNPTPAQVRAAGAGGAGGAGGRRAANPNAEIDEAVKFVVDSSNFKDQTTPADSSRMRRLARQFYDQSRGADGVPQLDAARAAEAAAVAVTQPDRLRLNFNPRTGEIVRELPMEGASFIVERIGKPGAASGLKKEELEQVARDQLAAAPVEQRELFLRAARSPDELKAVVSEIESAQRSQEGMQALTQALGRAPSEDEIKSVIKMTQDRVRSYGGLFSAHLPKELINPPKRAPRQPGGMDLGFDWQVAPGLGNTAAEMLNQGL